MRSDVVGRDAPPGRWSYVFDLIVVLWDGGNVVCVAALDGALSLDGGLLLLI